MFILTAILLVIIGVLLLIKATKMPKQQGLHIIVMIAAIGFILWGIVLTVFLLSGKIELPLG